MKILKSIVSALLCTIFFPVFIHDDSIVFSNSVFSVMFAAALFLMFKHCSQKNFSRRIKVYSSVTGFIFSVMTSFGYCFETSYSINFYDIKMYISILLYTYVFASLIRLLWTCFEQNEHYLTIQKYSGITAKIDTVLNWIMTHRLVMVIIILICWAPCFISTYPGNFRYDAASEFKQSIKGYRGDFPLLHSFIIVRLLTTVNNITGSYNAGIALYAIIQLVLLSCLFSHIIYTFCKQNTNRFLLLAMLIYYAAFPAIHLLVTCLVRDIMFSGLLIFSAFLLYQLALDRDSFMSKASNPFLLAIVLVLTLLSRNNNTGPIMPAALVAVSFAIAYMCRKKGFKGPVIFAATALSGYFILTALLTAACQPLAPPKKGSTLSLFSQSLVRAYYADSENWSEKDKEIFASYFPEGTPQYVPENADPTKLMLEIEEGQTKDFLRFWAEKGKTYPTVYINAVLANTRHMWFPASVIDGYNETGKLTFIDYDKCYLTFYKEIEWPGELAGYLPGVYDFYKNIGLFISFEKVPVISMLFSIGLHVWLLINCCFYAAYRKSRHLLLPLTVFAAYTLISAFVPLVILRYFTALFFAFPMVIAWSVQPASPLCGENNI